MTAPAPHVFRSSFGQCECLYCGRRRDGRACPMSADLREALAKFARENGRSWKAALRDLWESGDDAGELRQIRNIVGPTQLSRLPTRLVDAIATTPPRVLKYAGVLGHAFALIEPSDDKAAVGGFRTVGEFTSIPQEKRYSTPTSQLWQRLSRDEWRRVDLASTVAELSDDALGPPATSTPRKRSPRVGR